jgi:hypothetical protein
MDKGKLPLHEGQGGRRRLGIPRHGAPVGGGHTPGRALGGGGAPPPPQERGEASGHCGGAAGEGGGATGTSTQAGQPSGPVVHLGTGVVVALAGAPGMLRRVQP